MKHRVPRGMGTLSDAEIVALLKAELGRELRRCHRRRKQVFLDLFGGTAGVTAAIRKLGYGCICFELTRGQQYDLTCRAVLKLVKGWISSGVVIGASVATPCSTFSRARRGKPAVPDSGRIVRSRSHPWGILSLSPKERIAVDLGNATARASIQIIKNLTHHGLPVILENPINSQLFYVLQNLLRRKDCTCISTDQCQFGARWRKRTRLCCWNIHDPASLARLCKRRGFVQGASSTTSCLLDLPPRGSLGHALPKPTRRPSLGPLLTPSHFLLTSNICPM